MNKSIQELKQMYLSLFSLEPCPQGEVEKMEKALGVIFPQDFKDICNFYCGGAIGSFEGFNFNASINDAWSIVSKNLFYRKKLNLPYKYVILEETEVSATIFDTEKNKVFTVAIEDFFNICNRKSVQYEHEEYSSFSDFFYHLLMEEEAEPNFSL